MRKLVTMLLALVAACVVAGCDHGHLPITLFRMGTRAGCASTTASTIARSRFGVKKALPLPMRNGAIIVELPATGHFVTSTDMQFGSAPDQFFYTRNGKLTPLSQAHDSGMV